jgi:hypothetical protein
MEGGTPALPAGRGTAGRLGQVAAKCSIFEMLKAKFTKVLVGHEGPPLVHTHGPEYQALRQKMAILVPAGGYPALECSAALRSRPSRGGGGRRGGLPLLGFILRCGRVAGTSLLLLARCCAGCDHRALLAAGLRSLAALAGLARRHLVGRAAAACSCASS